MSKKPGQPLCTDTLVPPQLEKVDNLKYSKTKLPWFSCRLQHSARKRGGLILQRPRAHTGRRYKHSCNLLHKTHNYHWSQKSTKYYSLAASPLDQFCKVTDS